MMVHASGILLYLILFVSCLAHRVEILSPSSCENHSRSGSVRFKIQAWPVGLNKGVFVGQLAASHIHLEVSVKSSPDLDVWNFDVPPIPPVSHKKYLACLGEASVHQFNALGSVQRLPTGLSDPQVACKWAEVKNRYLFGGLLKSKNVIWEFGFALKKGMHIVTAQLRNTTDGLHLGTDTAYITVGLSPTKTELVEFADHLSGKHTWLSNEEKDLATTRRRVSHLHNSLHPDLSNPSLLSKHIDPALWRALESGGPLNIAELGHREAPGVFGMAIFTPEFCTMLMEEVAHAHNQSNQYTRPNTRNNYGVVLEELGFKPWLDDFLLKVLNPISAVFFEDWGGGSLDSHHAFTIRYKLGEDETTSRHMDLSEITLNVCLGKEFEGADLYFHGRRDHSDEKDEVGLLTHRPGIGILHVGQQYHGVHRLTKGERHNMVIWGRSSQFRSSAAEVFMRQCVHSGPSTVNPKLTIQTLLSLGDEL